jgi:hypothetical protein
VADIQHKNLTGADAAHPSAYVSESDPGSSLGAHREWRKPSTGVHKIRNAANTAWEDISIEGTSAGSAPELANLSDVDIITTPPADGEALVWDADNDEWIPGSVAAGSVAAADVSYAGGTGMSATNVESAIDELATEKANDTALTAHIDDTADAHDGTAISYAGGTGMSATHVEGAIDELATEKVDTTRTISTTAPLTGGGDLSANRTLAVSAGTETAAGVLELATNGETTTGTDTVRATHPAGVAAAIAAHTGDTTDAHDASAISIADAGGDFTATNVEDALAELFASGGGGGVADLDDLTDVDTTTTPPADGQALVWDDGDSLWVPGTVSGGGGGGNISGAYDIEDTSNYTPGSLADEFDTNTLDAKWTVIASTTTPAAGTADPYANPSTGIYDLTTRSNGMLVQPRQNSGSVDDVLLRQSGALANGESLVFSFGMPDIGTSVADGMIVGLALSTNSTYDSSGTWRAMLVRGTTNYKFDFYTGSAATVTNLRNYGTQSAPVLLGRRTYLRVTRRNTNDYWWMASFDGMNWIHLTKDTTSTSFSYVFLHARYNAAAPTMFPVFSFNWLRHVAATGHDLW